MAARISQKVAVGTVFVAAMFMSILDATIVNVALPTIGRDFGVSATAVDGIAIAFLVSLAITIPASGWLGDKYGGKRVLLAAIALFTAASALCGVASSLGELVMFRIFQGAAGPPRASRPRWRETAGYSPVWSSTSAPGAFFWTDSIPFSADALRSYISLVAMT